MRKERRGLREVVLLLDVLATPLLVFILTGIWLFREQVFVIGSPMTPATLTMMVGFGTILLFDLASVLWLGRRHFNTEDNPSRRGLFYLGVLCLILLGVQKVMADEIAHETAGGWTIQGEYVLLYGMLALQLVYNLLLGRHLLRVPQRGS